MMYTSGDLKTSGDTCINADVKTFEDTYIYGDVTSKVNGVVMSTLAMT